MVRKGCKSLFGPSVPRTTRSHRPSTAAHATLSEHPATYNAYMGCPPIRHNPHHGYDGSPPAGNRRAPVTRSGQWDRPCRVCDPFPDGSQTQWCREIRSWINPVTAIAESVLEQIEVAADTAARTLGTLLAVGAVLVVVLVGGVPRVTVVTARTIVAAIITIIAAVVAIVTVIVAATARTIVIITIIVAVVTVAATARTIVIITIVVIVAARTIATIVAVGTTIIAVGTTIVTAATATAAVLTVATLTARGRGLLILEARNRQADLAAVVDALHDGSARCAAGRRCPASGSRTRRSWWS